MYNITQATHTYSQSGIRKANLSISKMILLGMAAGFFIAVSATGAAAASVSVGDSSVAKLVNACIFPAGLAMVALNGSELFTGNNLLIISVLDKKIKLREMLKNWFFVYLGNLLGCLMFTFLCTYGHVFKLFNSDLSLSLLNTAVTKCNISFTDAVVKGIFCNMLVCAAVLMTYMAESASSKIMCLFFPIIVFVICGFEHSVANMSYISGGLFINQLYGNMSVDVEGLTWFNFIFTNLLPVTLGNIIGGTAMGALYWYANLHEDE